MARMSTCKSCGAKISKEEKLIISSKPYCKECGEKLQKESEEYKKLVEIICEYYQIQCCTGLMFKQIKEYKTQFEYTYNGMIYTLWYIKEIEKKSFSEIKFGVAYIKYYYEKAKDYYEQQSKISQSVTEKPIENIKTVTLKPSTQNDKQKYFLFDMNSLFIKKE